MKRVCGIGLGILGVLGVAAFLCGYIDPGNSRADVCAQGDTLRTARLLDAAKDTYAVDDCAGLKGIELTEADAEEHFATAYVYASTQPGNPVGSKRAIDNFAAGLALDPFDDKASVGLALELNKELVGPEVQCETGANLIDDGLLTLAGVALANGLAAGVERCETALLTLTTEQTTASTLLIEAKEGGEDDEYAEALRVNANLTAARTELEDSLNDDSLLDGLASWIAGIPGTLETALRWLIPLAVGLLLVAFGLWMSVRVLAAQWLWVRKKAERVGKHPGLSFFHRAAVPDIEIAPFGGKGESGLEGADFSTLLRGEIFKSTARGPAFPFDRVPIEPDPAPEEGVTVTELLTEIPATKVLGSVFQLTSRLFRRRTVLLSGHLTPAADKGAGVLLSLKGSRGRDAGITIWERVYDPNPGGEGAVRWLRLVPAAAAWAQWHLRWGQDPTRDFEPQGWETEALLKSAEAWELKEEPGRAEALYAAALEKDPGLLPAAHNLALIEIRQDSHVCALERVDALRTALEAGEPCGRTAKELRRLWPTLDAASLYTLILALAYLELDDSCAGQWDRDRPEARTEARRLVSTMARALATRDREAAAETKTETKKKEKKTPKKSAEATAEEEETRQLLTLFEATEAPSVVILASLELRKASRQGHRRAVQYALSGGAGVRRISRDQLGSAEIEGLKPWHLIHGYVEGKPNLPRRTYYNLACYYAALLDYAEEDSKPELYERALEKLKAGLVGGELTDWAAEDPSLAPLREFGPVAWYGPTKFTRVLEASTIEPHEKEEPAEQ